MGDKYGSQINK